MSKPRENEPGRPDKDDLKKLEKNSFSNLNSVFFILIFDVLLIFSYIFFIRYRALDPQFNVLSALLAILILCNITGYFIIQSSLKRAFSYAAGVKKTGVLKSNFIANLYHELINPLFSVMANIENVASGVYGTVNAKQAESLHLCQDVLNRMEKLVPSLIDMQKIEIGLAYLRRKRCNLVDMVERQEKEFEAKLRKKRLSISTESAGEDFSMWADEEKLLRAINNLLANAIKYTPEGGDINLKMERDVDKLKFVVHNSGPLIPKDELNGIFDKYRKVNVKEEGSGLGLAIAKDIVDMHKGKIWAESFPEKGNEFTVVLPFDLRK